jgi:hypothetical protein
MKSRLLESLAILSLACLIAVAGVWITSQQFVFQIFPPTENWLGVICRGRVYLLEDESHAALFGHADAQVDRGWHWAKTPVGQSLFTNFADPSIRLSGDIRWGFGILRVAYFRLGVFTRPCKEFVGSVWPAAAVFSFVPLLWLWRVAFGRRRRPGQCAACGYDLQATPDRCPECGTPAAAPGSGRQLRRVSRFGHLAVALTVIVLACFAGRSTLRNREVDTDFDLLGGVTQLYTIRQHDGSTRSLTIDQTIAPTASGAFGGGAMEPQIELKGPDAILARMNPSGGSEPTARPQELIADVNLVGHGGPNGISMAQNGLNEYSVGVNSQQKGWRWSLANDPPKLHGDAYEVTGAIVVEIYGDRVHKIEFTAMIHSASTVDPQWGTQLHPTGATVRWIGPE